jgi:hypothetical protein
MHAHVTVGCMHVHALLLVTLSLHSELQALRYLSTDITSFFLDVMNLPIQACCVI